jgi:hypothetical protein
MLLGVGLVLVLGTTGWAAEQSEAVAAITKLGGKVEVDEGSAGKPVVKVTLSNKPVKDADLVHLKGLTKLQELRLGGTQITDRGLEHLKGLTDLRKLILDRTEITDDGLKRLAPLTNLRWLNVCETPVTDAGVKHLKGLTKMEYVDLSVRGDTISDAAVKDLQKALPTVKVDR